MILFLKKTNVSHFIYIFTAIIISVSLTTMEAQAKNYNWKITQGIGEDHPAANVAKTFAKLIKEKSGGRIKLTYYPAGALGNWEEQIEATAMGTLEISVNGGSTPINPKTNFLYTPYVYFSYEKAVASIGSDGWATVKADEMWSGIGCKVLGIFANAWGGLAFTPKVKKVVKTPKDYKGIKIRTTPMRVFEIYIPALGFISTPIAFSETFSAMQTGIVDGRTGCPAVEAYMMRDALSYWVRTREYFENFLIFMNKKLWDSMSPEDQALLQSAADQVCKDASLVAAEEEKKYIKKLIAAGIGAHEVNRREWEACAKVVREKAWPQIEKELLGPELMKKIKAEATPLSN